MEHPKFLSGQPVQFLYQDWQRISKRGDKALANKYADALVAALEPSIQSKAGRYSLSGIVEGDELAQIGRITVIEALETYDPGRGSAADPAAPKAAIFLIYALSAAENAMRDAVRDENDRRRKEHPFLYGPEEAAADWPDSSERRVALDQYLSQLPERQRQVVEMRYLHGCTQQEIAGELNISQPRVAQIEKHGLAALRELIGEDGPSLLL